MLKMMKEKEVVASPSNGRRESRRMSKIVIKPEAHMLPHLAVDTSEHVVSPLKTNDFNMTPSQFVPTPSQFKQS